MFVLVAPPTPGGSVPAAIKAQYGKSGLDAPAVVAQLNKGFLSKELPFGTAETAAVLSKYNVTAYPTYLYFDPEGNLLHRRFGMASLPEPYLKDLDAAQQAQADPHNLRALEADYQRGNRSADFLKQYLTKYDQLGQTVDPALLNEYAEKLPAQAFYQGSEVLYILEKGPVVGSKAFQLSHLSQKLIDSLYRVLPYPQRTAINNRIIKNTSAQAIATKNREASQGANFARGTWQSSYQQGAQSYESNMLAFYQATKDTTAYLRQAVPYYERYYMNISADSARKAVTALQQLRQQQEAKGQHLGQLPRQR